MELVSFSPAGIVAFFIAILHIMKMIKYLGISTAEDIYRALGCTISLAPISRKEVQSAIKIIE